MHGIGIVELGLPLEVLGLNGNGGEVGIGSKSSKSTSTAVNMEGKKDRRKEIYRFRPNDESLEVECVDFFWTETLWGT